MCTIRKVEIMPVKPLRMSRRGDPDDWTDSIESIRLPDAHDREIDHCDAPATQALVSELQSE